MATDITARGMASSLQANDEKYFINVDHLESFKLQCSRMAVRLLGKVYVSVVGDSLSEGMNVNIAANYPALMRNFLKTKYNGDDCGRGLIHSKTIHSDLITYTGTWSDSVYWCGCAGVCKYSNVANSTATFTAYGTGVGIMLVGGQTGVIDIVVDGGTATRLDISTTSLSSTYMHEITGMQDGSHTVVITVVSGQFNFLGFYDIKGIAGIVVNNCAVSGSNSDMNSDGYAMDIEIGCWNPKLTIIELGGNDWNTGVPIADYIGNIRALTDRALGVGSAVLLLDAGVFNNSYTSNSAIATRLEYSDALRALAIEKEVAYADLIARWHHDGDYPTSQGIYADNVHPNQAGHFDIMKFLEQIL